VSAQETQVSSSMRVDELLERIGEKTPAPGGGAVTGVTGALGAALARMVVSYSVNSKKLAEHKPALERAAGRLDEERTALLELADEDARAYERLNRIMRLPEDDDRRAAELPDAATAAVEVPVAVIERCARLLGLFEELAGISNRLLRSDLAIAAILCEASARASLCNVRINLPTLREVGRDEGVLERSEELVRACGERLASVERACA
jgi:methenyltetrahydrofolate cyclohydrolase